MGGVGSIGFGEGLRADDLEGRNTYHVQQTQPKAFIEMEPFMYP